MTFRNTELDDVPCNPLCEAHRHRENDVARDRRKPSFQQRPVGVKVL
jgi:hypothetical protein